MSGFVARPYQTQAMLDIRNAFASGAKRVCFVLPTGGGKSFIASRIGAGLYKNSKRAVYLGHREEIVYQLGKAVREAGVPFEYLTASTPGMPRGQMIVASVGTMGSRLDRFPHEPDLIFVDECHHAVSKSWTAIIERFPNAKVVGLTATPLRLDGKGLNKIFDAMVMGPHTDELVAGGFLSDYDVYAPSAPDLSGVGTRGGDYKNAELEEAVRKAKLTGDAVKHYARLSPGKAAVVFCVSIAHAEEVAANFRSAGFDFRSIDGRMDGSQRRQLIKMLGDGKIHGLTSCEIVSEGTDIPRIETTVLLRPTKSLALYRQQVGRGLRPSPGKDKLLILDHAGNTHVHGLPDERIEWSLDGSFKRGAGGKGEPTKTCPSCFAIHKPAPVCPRCGHVYQVKGRSYEYVDEDLKKLDKNSRKLIDPNGDGTGKPQSYWANALKSLQAIERAKGYKRGWAEKILAHRQAIEREKLAKALASVEGVSVG